jgi:putative transposase
MALSSRDRFKKTYRVESSRYLPWDYSLPAWYFGTACTQHKICHFGRVLNGNFLSSEAGPIAEAALTTLPSHYSKVMLDTSVVMPNHVHMIIVLGPDSRCLSHKSGCPEPVANNRRASLGEIVGSYKSEVSRHCHAAGITNFGWQSRFYDHILRGPNTAAAVREYIRNNPLNWARDENYCVAAKIGDHRPLHRTAAISRAICTDRPNRRRGKPRLYNHRRDGAWPVQLARLQFFCLPADDSLASNHYQP